MVKENGMVMMTETELNRMKVEHENEIQDYARRIELLQEAITELIHSKKDGCKDVRVSKKDFLEMYETALNEMWEKETQGKDIYDGDIYGKDFTVHWNGIYCNCGDGATASNNIIPGIEGCYDEDSTEY